MEKTDKEISLFLLPEIRNVILDYIKHLKRKCDFKEILISDKGLFSTVKSTALYRKVKYYIFLSHIYTKIEKKA